MRKLLLALTVFSNGNLVNISVLILKDVLMISYMYSINIVHLHDDERMCLSSV